MNGKYFFVILKLNCFKLHI